MTQKKCSECPEIFIRFFLNISEFLVQIISEGGAPGEHNSPGRARTPKRALVGCGPHMGPLTYLFTSHYHSPLEKILHCSLSLCLSLSPVFLLSNPRILISLLEALFSKPFQGIVAWYVTPSFVQLVFVLVVYIFNN